MPQQARSKAEIERQAELNRARLLAAETAALTLLLVRRNSAVGSGLRKGGSLRSIASGIEDAVRGAVVSGRQMSRLTGVRRLQAELETVGIAAMGNPAFEAELAQDWVRGTIVGQSYADRWLRKAEGETTREAANAATEATTGSLRRIGVTESADAYGIGRAKYLRDIEEPVVNLLRVWDATLDIRTCPTCESADGKIVGARESFPDGEPGTVHSYCRCTWTLMTSAEIRGHMHIQRAPAHLASLGAR